MSDFKNDLKRLFLLFLPGQHCLASESACCYVTLCRLGPPLSATHGPARAAAFATLRHTESAAW
jgi:hypothetical protein